MNKQGLLELYIRDLDILTTEIESFEQEELIWKTAGSVSNSPGHLCFHICGNLRHYIGHILGNINYVRDRHHEFNGPTVTKEALVALIEKTKNELILAFNTIRETQLEETFPIQVLDSKIRTDKFLIHLYGHFGYHLGQINYFKRLI